MKRFFGRDLSWLSFNERVLQEAADRRNPVFERLKFLAIYSSNLDEFFRVRVPSLKALQLLFQDEPPPDEPSPAESLSRIREVVAGQQLEFGRIFQDVIVPDLAEHKVYISLPSQLSEAQNAYLLGFFEARVLPELKPMYLSQEKPFLNDKQLYLLVDSQAHPEGVLLEIPVRSAGRFIRLPEAGGEHHVVFVDDLIRHFLPRVLPGNEIRGAYALKVSRDAELYVEDEYSGDLIRKIEANLSKRDTGLPTRVLFDSAMPEQLHQQMLMLCKADDENIVPGGRYHNFNDLFSFPNPDGVLPVYQLRPPLVYPPFESSRSMFELIEESNHLVHYPYQRFDYVIKFLEEAARDSEVIHIRITLYRVNDDSRVCQALIKALEAGKEVTAFVEVKARFDEASNLYWSKRLQEAGAKILYSIPGLKVHAKLCLATKLIGAKRRYYAYLSTGNFNEKTALVYTDAGFFTADRRLAREVRWLFIQLAGNIKERSYEHLLIAPNYLRKHINRLIKMEIQAAEEGRHAEITIKLNSLEDRKMIERLYAASNAGVKITLIVRGICNLIPGRPGMSENIRIFSIVGRHLEHTRIYKFHHDGDPLYYLASADLMTRNLDRRVEVAFPVYDEKLQRELDDILELQLTDNVKRRILDAEQKNEYIDRGDSEALNSQKATYYYLQQKYKA